MSSPLGCSGHLPGCAVPVVAEVIERAWEVWQNSSTGVVEHRLLPPQVRDGASLLWSVESSEASLNDGDVRSDASREDGAATLTFAGYFGKGWPIIEARKIGIHQGQSSAWEKQAEIMLRRRRIFRSAAVASKLSSQASVTIKLAISWLLRCAHMYSTGLISGA